MVRDRLALSLLLHWTSRTALFGDLWCFRHPTFSGYCVFVPGPFCISVCLRLGKQLRLRYYIFTISGVRLRPCQSRVDLFCLLLMTYVATEACSFEASCFTVLIVQVLRSFGLTLRFVLFARFRTGYFYGTIIFGSVRTIRSFRRTIVCLARLHFMCFSGS